MTSSPGFLRAVVSAVLVAACGASLAQAPKARCTGVPIPTYGQHLVDEQVLQHPEVVRLALHANPPGSAENTIVASNFGRIGKKADQDDLDVIAAGVTHTDVDEKGKRVSIYPMLFDATGRKLGSVGVVFAYQKGDDLKKRVAEAEAIRDAMRPKIADNDSLFEAWPCHSK